MKLLALLFLVGVAICNAASTSKEDDTVTVTKDFFIDEFAIYTGQHDIVNINVPLKGLELDNDDDTEVTLFFVEADMKDGKKDYKGLYILKDKTATKLLDNGRDIASNDNQNVIYFGASDGIYKYNSEKNTAEKYGTITDSIMNLEKQTDTDVMYMLTDNKEVFKVTDNGNKKEKVTEVGNPEEILMDNSNNVFYYGTDKTPHVMTKTGEVKKIEGIPATPTEVRMMRPPFIYEEGVVFLSDDKPYIIYPNGTSEVTDFVVQVKPTAYAPEATILQYYGYNKKIYEYNMLAILIGSMLEELKEYLSDKSDAIHNIANNTKKTKTMF